MPDRQRPQPIGSSPQFDSITYDSNSNRLAYGATSYTIPSTSNKMSVAGGSSITYTSAGNINGIGSNSMTYNKANRMATATVSGTTSTYTYDAFGQRLLFKPGSANTQTEQYDQDGNLLTETNNNVETDYAYGQVDPIGLIGGANPFVYGDSNPFKNIDPWGLKDYPHNTMGPLKPGDHYYPPVRPTLPPTINCPHSESECAGSPYFKPYVNPVGEFFFHCGDTVYVQKDPPEGRKQQECGYDLDSLDTSACGGSPNDFDAETHPKEHTNNDGGAYLTHFHTYQNLLKNGMMASHPDRPPKLEK